MFSGITIADSNIKYCNLHTLLWTHIINCIAVDRNEVHVTCSTVKATAAVLIDHGTLLDYLTFCFLFDGVVLASQITLSALRLALFSVSLRSSSMVLLGLILLSL